MNARNLVHIREQQPTGIASHHGYRAARYDSQTVGAAEYTVHAIKQPFVEIRQLRRTGLLADLLPVQSTGSDKQLVEDQLTGQQLGSSGTKQDRGAMMSFCVSLIGLRVNSIRDLLIVLIQVSTSVAVSTSPTR